MVCDEEPDRLVATHLEALDDALIIAAGRFGDVLGGGRRPDRLEREDLRELHRVLDRLCHEYAAALKLTGFAADPEKPWKGGRWIVRTEAGPRYPSTLAMLLFDSSEVNKDASLEEHREALRSVMTGAKAADADPFAVGLRARRAALGLAALGLADGGTARRAPPSRSRGAGSSSGRFCE